MAERVVDVLEMVNVEIHQCNARVVASCQGDRLGQPVGQKGPVWQTRERVVRRHVRYLRCAQVGRVLHGLGPDDGDHQAFVGLAHLYLDQEILVGNTLRCSITLVQCMLLQH